MSEQLVKLPNDVALFIRQQATVIQPQNIHFIACYFIPEEDQDNIFTMLSLDEMPDAIKQKLGL